MLVFKKKQTGQISTLLLLIFLDSLGYFLIIPVFLRLFMPGSDSIFPVETSHAVRNSWYGISLMLSPLAALLFGPYIGHLSDRYGRKKTLLFCLLFAVIGFLLPIIGILKKSLVFILVGRVIAGASSSSQPVAQAAATDLYQHKERALMLSFIACAMTLAMVLGPLCGAYLSDHHLWSALGVRMPYYVGAGLSILNILLFLVFFKNTTPAKTHTPHTASLLQLIAVLKQKKIWSLLLVFFFMEIAWSQYYQAIFLYLDQVSHYPIEKIGVFAAYIGFWMCLGLTWIYQLLLQNFTLEKILGLCLWVSLLGLIGCNIPINDCQWLFIIPLSIGIGAAYPSIVALISHEAHPSHRGGTLGSISVFLNLSWMMTGFSAGFLMRFQMQLPLLIALFALMIAIFLYKISIKAYRDVRQN